MLQLLLFTLGAGGPWIGTLVRLAPLSAHCLRGHLPRVRILADASLVEPAMSRRMLNAIGEQIRKSRARQVLQSRPLKAGRSRQVKDFDQGRGMGMALTAKLNGYPDPHILGLTDRLRLKLNQISTVQSLFESMNASRSRRAQS